MKFLPLILLFHLNAIATTKLTYPTYFKTINTTDVSNPILYAGKTSAFTYTATSPDNLTPYNSCKDMTSFADGACSEYEIYPNLYFTVTLNSTQADISSTSKIVITDGTNSALGTIISGTVNENTDVQARWTWSELCEALTEDSNCAKSFSKTLKIGFSADETVTEDSHFIGSDYAKFTLKFRAINYAPANTSATKTWCKPGVIPASAYQTGFCYFNVFPGDEKVFISTSHQDSEPSTSCSSKVNFFKVPDLEASSTPGDYDESGIKYTALRVFYTEGSSYSSVGPTSSHQDISVADCDLTSDMVNGLKNDTDYVFNIANVDEAGIVSYFFDSSEFEPEDFSDTSKFGKVQSARPQKVFGLLNNKSCFIATASFGSSMANEVETLRQFRDQFLLTNKVGKEFVKAYYFFSPPLANFIAESEWLRAISRWILWPAVFFAEVSLKYGIFWAALLVVTLLIGARSIKKRIFKII